VADSTKRIEIIVEGKDQASGALGAVGGALGRVGEIAGGIISAEVLMKVGEKIFEIGKQCLETASRVQEMGVVLVQLGKTAGISSDEINAQVEAVKKMGITTQVAQNTVAAFIRYQMNMADAAKLARVAQDAAVLSMQDSSTTLDNLIYGIQTFNVRVLRTNGIVVDGQKAFNDYAKSIGKTAAELDSTEKQQAFLNAVIAAGVPIQGAYEAAMNTAGKQIRSFPRYFAELAESIGNRLLPAFTDVIFGISDFVKWMMKAVEEGGALSPIIDNIGAVVSVAGKAFKTFLGALSSGLGEGKGPLEALSGALQAAFSGLGIKGNLLENLFGAGTLASLQGSLDKLKTSFGNLISYINSGFGSNVWTTILGVAQNLFKTITGFVSSNIVPFLVSQFQKFSAWFIENGPLIEKFVAAIGKAITTIIPIVLGLWKVIFPILNGIINIVLDLARIIMQVVTGDFSGAWMTLRKLVTDAAEAIWAALLALINWIANIFGSSLDNIVAWWTGLWQKASSDTTSIWTGIANFFTGIWNSIAGFFTNIWNGIVNTLTTIWNTITTIINTAWNVIVQIFTTIQLVILGIIFTLLDGILGLFGTNLQTLILQWQTTWNAIVARVQQAWGKITLWLQTAWNNIVTWCTTMWELFEQSWLNMWNMIVTILLNIAIPLLNAGMTVINTLWTGLQTIWTSISTWWVTIWDGVITTILSLVERFTDAGRQVVQGLWDGFKEVWERMAAWVWEKVEALINKAKSILGIASPSKVFRDIGSNISAGLYQGLNAPNPYSGVYSHYGDQSENPGYYIPASTNHRCVTNNITLNVSGASPSEVSDEIMRQLRLQGVSFTA
jgi:phage-related protein